MDGTSIPEQLEFFKPKVRRTFRLIGYFIAFISIVLTIDFISPSVSVTEKITRKISYSQKRLRSRSRRITGIATTANEYVLNKRDFHLFNIEQEILVYRSPILLVPRKLKTGNKYVTIASIYNGYGIFIFGLVISNFLTIYFSFRSDSKLLSALTATLIILFSLVYGYFSNRVV